MKPFRLLAIIAGALVLLVALVVAVALNSAFQTWAARRVIAANPGVHATVGVVSAGIQRLELKDLQYEQNGAVLTLPAVQIEVPLITAGWSKKVFVSRLVAKGWTLDLSKMGQGTPSTSANGAARPLPPTALQAFAGVFSQLQLPLDVSLDGVDLAGEVILPDGRGKSKLTITGGGLTAGHEGTFDLVATGELTDREVNSVELRTHVVAAMDTPRTFTRILLKSDAAAKGAKFPNGVKLTADLNAARSEAGESYTLGVATEHQEIVSVKAEFPRAAERLTGTWKLDIRDADVAPFALGLALPGFVAVGEGTFETDPKFAAVRAAGRLTTTADRLQAVRTELAALGELKVAADFDVLERGGTLAVQKLEAKITGREPVAAVQALQPFEFNPRTGELRVTDAAHEAFGIALQGLPVAWVAPFLKSVGITGGHLRGEVVAAPRGGGVVVKSTAPLTLDHVSVEQAGKPLVRDIDVSLNVSGDYAPQGWQAEITALNIKSADATLVSADIKAGQLAGPQQPIKATGKLSGKLAALLQQPVAGGFVVLTSGDASIEFAASFNAKQEVQAKVALRELATAGEKKPVELPALTADVRADRATDGKLTFWSPILIEFSGRKSDVTVTGSLAPVKDKLRTIELNLTSNQLVLDDAKIFRAVLPLAKKSEAKPSVENAPPWAGFVGAIGLQLKRVVYSDTFEVTELNGRVQLDAGKLKLEGLQAALGDSGRANLNGIVTFDAAAPQPYALKAEMGIKEFDPGPLFRAVNGNQPPTVEGRFDVSSKLASHARTLGDLAAGADGDFQLTSKGGVFRGLPLNATHLVENTGKLANLIASAGTALSAMTGRKNTDEIANKAQAVAELSKGLYPLPFDQLSVVVSRDAALNTTLRDFTLISPEVRLTGGGTALHKPGSRLLDDPLAMEFRLRTRGRLEALLKYLGAVEPRPDELGYAACTIPLRIGGTLGKPDTSELNKNLTALAIEKSGVTEKAGELIDKLFGRTKG